MKSYWSKMKREVKVSFMVMSFITMSLPIFASFGLAVRFPDLVMERVDPGTFLNLRKDKNVPYVLMNRVDGPIDITVTSEQPPRGGLKEGYEPLPDLQWLKIIPGEFHLEKGEVASADVILSVPNDPSLVGRHFQANILASTKGKGFVEAGVLHIVRFSVGSLGPDALKHEKALQTLETLDLDMTPGSLTVPKLPLGRKLSFKKDLKSGPLKITNRGAETLKLRFSSVPVDNNLKRTGYDATPAPEWLTVKPDVLKVKTNRIEEMDLFIEIPDAPENRGRNFMFVVRAELDGMQIPLAIHSRIYVTTEGEPVKTE